MTGKRLFAAHEPAKLARALEHDRLRGCAERSGKVMQMTSPQKAA
jgi:hypothetical protein